MINPFDDTYYMKKALQEAQDAYDKGEIPVGAVIVIKDRIIARAHNLTELLNDLTNCTLYVTLEPCQMCAGALYWSQISKIIYGARDEERGCIALNTKLHPKTKIVGGVLADEASALIKRFFIERRNLN
jgi:tRNA(adenine34) deaminase